MIGLGTIANVAGILAGSCLGLLLGRGIKDRYREIVMQAIGLCVVIIGLQMALKTQNIMVDIVSLVIGSIIGEYFDIEGKLNHLGQFLGNKFNKKKSPSGEDLKDGFVEGFVSASLIFCVGAMAIVGSLEDGLKGNPAILYAKTLMDATGAVVFSANFGIGVAFSALSVGVYQGILTLLASWVGPYLTENVIEAFSSVGGVLILAIGINMFDVIKLRIGNMLPAMFVAGIIAAIM
jgi:uncharacterized membrane protein YqgA involved in biofilm formation